ncbi:MAG: YuiB family protein [Alicyclobacillus sp.]|nr:YuiB family protein [Alicyclobacillus sp.]
MFTYWTLLYILGIVSTFGFGVALNMVVRRGWVAPLIAVCLAGYTLLKTRAHLTGPLWGLFSICLAGALLSGWAVRSLRRRGYSLFTR